MESCFKSIEPHHSSTRVFCQITVLILHSVEKCEASFNILTALTGDKKQTADSFMQYKFNMVFNKVYEYLGLRHNESAADLQVSFCWGDTQNALGCQNGCPQFDTFVEKSEYSVASQTTKKTTTVWHIWFSLYS